MTDRQRTTNEIQRTNELQQIRDAVVAIKAEFVNRDAVLAIIDAHLPKPSKFNVGDRLKVVGPDCTGSERWIGYVGELDEFEPETDTPYAVRFDAGRVWFAESSLIAYDGPKFKEGDRVKIVWSGSTCNERVVTVARVLLRHPRLGGTWYGEDDTYKGNTWPESLLSAYDPEADLRDFYLNKGIDVREFDRLLQAVKDEAKR